VIYLLDTTIISALLKNNQTVFNAVERHKDDTLSLCPPVHFEVRRGLLWKNAQVQWNAYTQDIVPRFTWIPLLEADWEQAAVFWAQTRKAGRQLSDIDLLIAAITLRVEGTIASNDADFDALDVPRVNWHNAP
jgi:predicted nucleic acid-binding protein